MAETSVTRGRRLTVRMGEYESMEIFASITFEPEAMPEDYDPNVDLDELIRGDVEDAHFLTDKDRSFIHDYHEDINNRKATPSK